MPVPETPAPRPPAPPHFDNPSNAFGHRRRLFLIAAVGVIGILTVFGIGLYRYGWNGPMTRAITAVLPYPAAIVNGRIVRYADYQEDLGVLERFYQAERGRATADPVVPTEEELKRRVLDRLIMDQIVYALAGRYHVVVTSDEVKKAYETTILDQASLATVMGKAKAEAQAASTLLELYGVRPSQFQNRVLHPFLMRQKLEQAVQSDEALNGEKKKKAGAALAALQEGKSFREVAMAYSEDQNVAETGGDRGLIGRGLLPPEAEAVAFALKDGETSGIVKSPLGYHIMRVTGHEQTDGHVQKVRLQEILIHPIRLDDYLEVQRKSARVIVFVH